MVKTMTGPCRVSSACAVVLALGLAMCLFAGAADARSAHSQIAHRKQSCTKNLSITLVSYGPASGATSDACFGLEGVVASATHISAYYTCSRVTGTNYDNWSVGATAYDDLISLSTAAKNAVIACTNLAYAACASRGSCGSSALYIYEPYPLVGNPNLIQTRVYDEAYTYGEYSTWTQSYSGERPMVDVTGLSGSSMNAVISTICGRIAAGTYLGIYNAAGSTLNWASLKSALDTYC
jgi:hypothetical protein